MTSCLPSPATAPLSGLQPTDHAACPHRVRRPGGLDYRLGWLQGERRLGLCPLRSLSSSARPPLAPLALSLPLSLPLPLCLALAPPLPLFLAPPPPSGLPQPPRPLSASVFRPCSTLSRGRFCLCFSLWLASLLREPTERRTHLTSGQWHVCMRPLLQRAPRQNARQVGSEKMTLVYLYAAELQTGVFAPPQARGSAHATAHPSGRTLATLSHLAGCPKGRRGRGREGWEMPLREGRPCLWHGTMHGGLAERVLRAAAASGPRTLGQVKGMPPTGLRGAGLVLDGECFTDRGRSSKPGGSGSKASESKGQKPGAGQQLR